MISRAGAHHSHPSPSVQQHGGSQPRSQQPAARVPPFFLDAFSAARPDIHRPKGVMALDRKHPVVPEPLRRYTTRQLIDLCEAAKKGDPAAVAKLKRLFEDVLRLSPTGSKIMDWIQKTGIEIQFQDTGHANQAEMATTPDGGRALTVNLTTFVENLKNIESNAALLQKGGSLPPGTQITELPFGNDPTSPVFPLVGYASSLAHEGFHWMVGDVPFQGGGAFGLPKNIPRQWGDDTQLTYLINGRVVAEILGVPYNSPIVVGKPPQGFNYDQVLRAKDLVEPMKLQWMNGKPGDGYLIGGPWDRFLADPKLVFSLFDGLY